MKTAPKTAALACIFAALSLASHAQEAPSRALPTAETAKPGEVYLAEKSDPWELRCTKVETGTPPCQMFQVLRNSAGGDGAEFSLFKIPEGNKAAAGAMVVMPLETLLETGLVIRVDDHDPRGYPFAYCNSYGCIARVGFTKEELGWLKSGKSAVMTVSPAMAPDKRIDMTLSLAGFTAMLEKTGPAK